MLTVNQSANSLLGIVNDILDFSKMKRENLIYISKKKMSKLLDQIID
jgi:signal transduction histidine kinase